MQSSGMSFQGSIECWKSALIIQQWNPINKTCIRWIGRLIMGCKKLQDQERPVSPGDLSSITRAIRTFFYPLPVQCFIRQTHQHNQPISLSAWMRILWRLISSITTTFTGQPISGDHQLCRNKTIMARLKWHGDAWCCCFCYHYCPHKTHIIHIYYLYAKSHLPWPNEKT